MNACHVLRLQEASEAWANAHGRWRREQPGKPGKVRRTPPRLDALQRVRANNISATLCILCFVDRDAVSACALAGWP